MVVVVVEQHKRDVTDGIGADAEYWINRAAGVANEKCPDGVADAVAAAQRYAGAEPVLALLEELGELFVEGLREAGRPHEVEVCAARSARRA